MRDKFFGEFSFRRKGRRSSPALPLFLVLCGVVAGLAAGTQYLASALPGSLGAPLLRISGVEIHAPHLVLSLAPRLLAEAPSEMRLAGATATLLLVGSVVISLGLARRAAGGSGKGDEQSRTLHGSAHWASLEEIREAGLLPRKKRPGCGVYVGGWADASGALHYLRHNGPEHVLAFAPTGSGKGVGLVLPTLLSWPESALVFDLKGENWALSAGWRSTEGKNRVLRLDPAEHDPELRNARYNPLAEVRPGEREIGDVQSLAHILVDPDGKGVEGDHWRQTAHALLVGAILHCLHDPERSALVPSLASVAQTLVQPGKEYLEIFEGWLATTYDDSRAQVVIHAAAQDMLARDSREASGVLSTAMSFLTLYRDPTIAINTARSTFRLADLLDGAEPATLYVVVRPGDLARLVPFVRILITQLLHTQMDSLAFENGKAKNPHAWRLLLLLDEFPALGRLPVFERCIAYMRAWGMKAYLIAQDLPQIRQAYGKDESVASNCHIKVAYATNNPETAELLSRMTGTTTVQKVARTVSHSGDGPFGKRQVSESVQEISRALLTPDECAKIPGARKDAAGNIVEPGDMLIFPAGFPAIYGRQILYFRDRTFSARARIPAPLACD